MGFFINLSNHNSRNWDELQLKSAEGVGTVIDLAFPYIDPQLDKEGIEALGQEYLHIIQKFGDIAAVHLMGEQSFCFDLANRLKQAGIRVVVSSTHRKTFEDQNGNKVSRFEFVKFRDL